LILAKKIATTHRAEVHATRITPTRGNCVAESHNDREATLNETVHGASSGKADRLEGDRDMMQRAGICRLRSIK